MQSNANHTARIHESFRSQTGELHRIRELVESEAIRFGFDHETAFRLALAVDEACTNIIKHSYEGNPSRTFDLEIIANGDQFQIVLTDQGKRFTPGRLPDLDM